jgi:hypothetical protein
MLDLNFCFQGYFNGFIYYAVKIKKKLSLINLKMNESYENN